MFQITKSCWGAVDQFRVNYRLYFHDLGNFAALEGINHGHTQATIAQVIELARAHPYDPFYAIWEKTREAGHEALATAAYGAPTSAASVAVNSSSSPPKK